MCQQICQVNQVLFPDPALGARRVLPIDETGNCIGPDFGNFGDHTFWEIVKENLQRNTVCSPNVYSPKFVLDSLFVKRIPKVWALEKTNTRRSLRVTPNDGGELNC